MNIRAASVLFAFTFALISLPAHAQGPGGPPPNYQQIAAQVANLQARVAKLEGNITAADLAGTYTYTHLITGLTGGSPAAIASGIFTGTVTLAADGSGSGNFTLRGDTLTQGTPWSLTQITGAETDSVTWTYANGTLTIVTADGPAPFSVAAGGRLAILAIEGPETGARATNLIILTRLQ